MRRIALTAIAATLGWWMSILVGLTVGGAIGFLASPLVGRAVGGLLAGILGGAVEARSMASMRGRRLRFAAASALATAITATLLIDVQVMPWLVGAAFGASIAIAQGFAVGLPRRDVVLRALTSSAAWSLGFVVLHGGGTYGKLGVVAPGLAVVLLALASSPRVQPSVATA
jgi:hypothetical protein